MVLQVLLHLGHQLNVVRPQGVQPEHRRGLRGPGARDRQLDPVANGPILDLAHPPDVPGLHVVLEEHSPGVRGHVDAAGAGGLEGLVVGAVLLGLLGHEPHVGHRPHRGGVEGAVLLAEVDGGLVHARVVAVRDDELGVMELVVGAPHAARVADGGGHGGVDDDVAGDVQVRDALRGVDHAHGGA